MDQYEPIFSSYQHAGVSFCDHAASLYQSIYLSTYLSVHNLFKTLLLPHAFMDFFETWI